MQAGKRRGELNLITDSASFHWEEKPLNGAPEKKEKEALNQPP